MGVKQKWRISVPIRAIFLLIFAGPLALPPGELSPQVTERVTCALPARDVWPLALPPGKLSPQVTERATCALPALAAPGPWLSLRESCHRR